MEELQKAVKGLRFNKQYISVERDDIVQNVALILLNDLEMAKDIYENKKIGTLYVIVKREIYNNEAKFYFDNKMELSRFQRILAVCEKYDIKPVPENAYKISAILETGNNNFTVSGVESLLSRIPPDFEKLVPFSINTGDEDELEGV